MSTYAYLTPSNTSGTPNNSILNKEAFRIDHLHQTIRAYVPGVMWRNIVRNMPDSFNICVTTDASPTVYLLNEVRAFDKQLWNLVDNLGYDWIGPEACEFSDYSVFVDVT